MALYSVWDWERNTWGIYSTPDHVSVGDDPKPPKPSEVHVIGADPDTQAKPLPPGARFVGYDHMARGEVRRNPNLPVSLGEVAEGSDLAKYAVGAAIGAGVVWFLMREND